MLKSKCISMDIMINKRIHFNEKIIKFTLNIRNCLGKIKIVLTNN